MADVSLSHGAAGTELDAVNEARVRRVCRAEDPRAQFERRCRKLSPRILSGLKAEHQPRPEMAMKTGSRSQHVVLLVSCV